MFLKDFFKPGFSLMYSVLYTRVLPLYPLIDIFLFPLTFSFHMMNPMAIQRSFHILILLLPPLEFEHSYDYDLNGPHVLSYILSHVLSSALKDASWRTSVGHSQKQ